MLSTLHQLLPSFSNVQPRISKTLVKAFLDPTKPLATHYGAQGGKGD